MRAQLRVVTPEELKDLDKEVQDFAAQSDLLITLTFDGKLAGLIGFIPRDIGAYLWMHKTQVAEGYPRSYARYAKRVIDCFKGRYGTVRGHSNPQSERWLKFLGATIIPINPNLVEFLIDGR